MVSPLSNAQKAKHTFKFSGPEFLLDDKPFQIISGEMHPARIPAEYWKHRIRMAKAMGCNTISAYIFWNYHESEEGVYDFSTGNHNIASFIKMVQEKDVAYFTSRTVLSAQNGNLAAYLLIFSGFLT